MTKRLGVAVLAASLACSAAHAATYPAMYSFGDSLSDVGNAYIASGLIGTPVPISPPYAAGRFSNGPIWLDDLSAKLGLGAVSPSFAGGDDFAFGGAQTGPTNVNLGVPTDLIGQVAAFHLQVPSPASDALYTLDIGANDIGNALAALAADPTFSLSTFLSDAVGNTVGAIDTLYSDGARDLLYYEAPDLSVVPGFEAAGSLGGELATQFNDDVLAGIKPLEAKGLTVFDVPIFSAIDKIVADPSRFGLTNVTSPCFSGGFETPGSVCADPNSFLFWDGEHPTAAVHALTADLAFDVLNSTTDPLLAPEPSTWAMMLIGFAGLSFAYWRARLAGTASIA
jgi:phospholipase/lecithinase/hemolysin